MRKRLLSIFLVLVMVLCLAPMTVFADNTPTSVATEAELRRALGNGESVKLAADITLTSDLDITKKVSIDLNGYTIKGEPIYKNESYTVFELTISDSKGGGQIVCPLYNAGSVDLVIENGIFSEQITGGKYGLSTNLKISNGTFNKGVVARGIGYIFGGTFKGDDTITLRDGSEITNYAVQLLGRQSGIMGGNFDCNVQTYGFDSGGAFYSGIHGGTFNKIVDIIQQGCIYDGNFLGKVIFESIGTITGGTFSNAVTNTGTITGGTFSGDVIAASGPVILPGRTVESPSIISGGDFSGTVTNDSKGTISGGTFKNKVINNGTITGGTFNKEVENNGTITGGTYYGGITGTGTIDGLTVTYKNGNEDYAVQVVQNGDNAVKPIVPVQTGYLFDGWYTDEECTTSFDFENTKIIENRTIYSKWKVCDHTGNTNALSCTEDTICSVCSGTIKAAHLLCWKADATHYWQECYRSGCDYTTVNNKKEIPTIEIKGNDKVHTDQDYSFSFEVPEDSTVVRVEYKIPMTGSFNLKVNAENGIYTGVMSKDNYAGAENFGILVTVKINDGYEFETTKNVKLTDEHEGGEATCNEQAVCDICGEHYGEKDQSNHVNLKQFPAKAATTAAEGNIEYWYCDGCEKYFSDENGTKEITLKDTLIAKLAPAKKTKSPQTGDESNMFLWLALILVSGGAVTTATIPGKKRKYNR